MYHVLSRWPKGVTGHREWMAKGSTRVAPRARHCGIYPPAPRPPPDPASPSTSRPPGGRCGRRGPSFAPKMGGRTPPAAPRGRRAAGRCTATGQMPGDAVTSPSSDVAVYADLHPAPSWRAWAPMLRRALASALPVDVSALLKVWVSGLGSGRVETVLVFPPDLSQRAVEVQQLRICRGHDCRSKRQRDACVSFLQRATHQRRP